jgi:DivIVA domain-containing protein
VTWVLAILIVLALGGVAVVAAGKGTPMADAYDDRPDALVPGDRPLVGADLRRVRFSLALRGYRMSEVDALLDRLAAQLEAAHDSAAATDDSAAADRDAAAADQDTRPDDAAGTDRAAGPDADGDTVDAPGADPEAVSGEGRGGSRRA